MFFLFSFPKECNLSLLTPILLICEFPLERNENFVDFFVFFIRVSRQSNWGIFTTLFVSIDSIPCLIRWVLPSTLALPGGPFLK